MSCFLAFYKIPTTRLLVQISKFTDYEVCIWLRITIVTDANSIRSGLNVSTTPITAMGCRQLLPLSIVQIKSRHCRKPHCRNGVVDTFELWLQDVSSKKNKWYVVLIKFLKLRFNAIRKWNTLAVAFNSIITWQITVYFWSKNPWNSDLFPNLIKKLFNFYLGTNTW